MGWLLDIARGQHAQESGLGRTKNKAGSHVANGSDNRIAETKETNFTKQGRFSGDGGIPSANWEWILERAAIMEIDGGMAPDAASLKAFEFWFNAFIGNW